MSGFFMVTDVPARRVVQYKRITGYAEGVVHIEDETILGDPVDEMPYADKTGIGVAAGDILFEVPYLENAGKVYFAEQPVDSEVGATLTAVTKAGTEPHSFQWYKDDKQVVNVPDSVAALTVTEAGRYLAVVTDANGEQAVSRAAEVK
jgi:hypothetical protein